MVLTRVHLSRLVRCDRCASRLLALCKVLVHALLALVQRLGRGQLEARMPPCLVIVGQRVVGGHVDLLAVRGDVEPGDDRVSEQMFLFSLADRGWMTMKGSVPKYLRWIHV
jgi:hypothetical protein